jgi:hypothetical protein
VTPRRERDYLTTGDADIVVLTKNSIEFELVKGTTETTVGHKHHVSTNLSRKVNTSGKAGESGQIGNIDINIMFFAISIPQNLPWRLFLRY